jgi:predicted phosphate transport protein (TIGR00153 family)
MRFLPREEKFYALFLDQVRLISEANTLLLNGLKSGNSTLEEAADRITALERKADAVIGEIFQRLGQTFITPIDAEDIHSLATRLDDVIDGIEDLAHSIVAYQIEPVPAIAVEVVTDIGACVKALDDAFNALQNHGNVVESCIEISRIEEEVDVKIRGAVRDLFRNEKDAIQIIKLKEVLDLLEETTDYCDDVSVALQNVIIKNS